MGQKQSASAAEEPPGEGLRRDSRYAGIFRRLYSELTALDDAGAPADDKVFRNRFESYFGGPYLEFGRLLYSKLFGPLVPVDEETFVSALTVLERVCGGEKVEHMETESFFFSVFSEGADAIDKQQLMKVLHMAATFAMVVGSELHEQAVLPKDHFLLTSITEAAWLHADKEKGGLRKTQFSVWVSRHCCRLLEGMKHWLLSLLHGQSPHQDTPTSDQPTASGATPVITPMSFQLPTPHWDRPGDSAQRLAREREMTMVIWVLSAILPLVYLGHKDDGRKNTKPTHDYPVGGTWTLLYSSSVHGFSMNRFQHHCSDYREPSVLLLRCHNDLENKDYTFAIAMDSEWRDGSYYYGGEKFCFVQLQPNFVLMRTGPKLVSLNEKQRGFPTGLRVMASDQYNQCLLAVEPSLETAQFQGVDLIVKVVEVWGCGGVEAIESQRRMKAWENRLILRQRKVRTADLKETWEDSPDRFILDMGGVTTKRPQEQQQQ